MRIAKRFFLNSFLLAVSAVIMRSISLSFSAYVSRTAGTEAMGVFSQIMSVFSFALTLASSGVGLAVTRLVSEALGKDDHGLARKYMRSCLTYCSVFGVSASVLLFVFAEPIGKNILGDDRTVMSMRILASALPFISVSSALGGYFTAVRRVYKSTAFTTLEQFVKIYFTIKLFAHFTGRGVEYACIALVLADTISEVSAAVISALLYLADRKRYLKSATCDTSSASAFRALAEISLPIAASTYIRSGLLTVEHILIPKSLIKSGLLRSEALSLYGMLHSMIMPVLLFPTAVISSFSGLLVPELAEAKVKNKKALVAFTATRAFKYSILFSFCVCGVFLCFGDELGMLIYHSDEVGYFIRMIAPLVPVMYLDGVTDAMLKGLGEQVYSMNVNIIDAGLSVICVILLLPRYGIFGYVITIYITETANAFLSVLKLARITDLSLNVRSLILSPALAVLGAASISRLTLGIADLSVGRTVETVVGTLLFTVIYFIFARLTGGIEKRDIGYIKGAIRPARR